MGGVGKYAQLIDHVHRYAPIKMTSLCILGKNWWHDAEGLKTIAAKKIYITSRFDFSWIGKVAREIDQLSPDLIMTHGFNGHFVVLATRLLAQRKPGLICSYHGSYHAITFHRKVLEKWFDAFTEVYIRYIVLSCVAVAGYTKKYLIKKGVSHSKIHVIHNGIRDNQPAAIIGQQLRREWEIADNEILVGAASRLDPVKGLEFLIEAFAKLSKKWANLKLVIIGTGTSEGKLQLMVKSFGLSNKVIFTGFREDVSACLSAIDIFALPSLAEYHSIALLEAMRAAKVIVATDVGGNTESVRNFKEGLIVPAADVERLVHAIDRIVIDRLLAKNLGEAARERFKKTFTEEIMVRQTAQWLVRCATLKTSNQLGLLNRK